MTVARHEFRPDAVEFRGVAIYKTRRSLPWLLCLWSVLGLTSLSAQSGRRLTQKLPSTFTLASIKATGSKRYASDQIVAATRLEPGQMAGKSDFDRASERLGESGAFSSVTYTFEYSSEGAKLALQVADQDHFVPTYFDNFVWFSTRELKQALQSRVPLFQGELPTDGKLASQVSDALQSMLVERHVQGRVDYLRVGADTGTLESYLYSVSGPTIRIRNVEFKGAQAKDLPLLQSESARLQGQDFQRTTIKTEAEKNLSPVYLAQGYLKASFADFDASAVNQTDDATDVDVTFTVNPGKQYKVKEIQFAGSKILPADKLRELIRLQAGQPANAVEMSRDVEAIKKLYGSHGYMAVGIQILPAMDDASSTVSYQLKITEGDLYHMGELDVQDLDHHDTDRVSARWAIAKGDPYDSSYPKRFVDEILKDVLTTGEYNVNIRELPDPADKSVDVSVKFERKETL